MGVLNKAELLAAGFADAAKDVIAAALAAAAVLTTPEAAGAVDGADAGAAVAGLPEVWLKPGKQYRIAAGTTREVGLINNSRGGWFFIEDGAELIYDGTSDHNRMCFRGPGKATPSNGVFHLENYSTAEGSAIPTFDERINFARRSMVSGGYKEIHWQSPRRSFADASYAADTKTTAWKVKDPILWGDDMNNCLVFASGGLIAARYQMDAVLLFSNDLKTEDIYFVNGLSVDGGYASTDGVRMRAGARIQFFARMRSSRNLRYGVNLSCDMPISAGSGAGMDEITFDFLNITDNGSYGLNVECPDGGHVPYGFSVKHLMHNGARGVYATATVSNGVVQSLTIPAQGPGGKTQDLRGFAGGLTYNIASLPGNGNSGRNGVATATTATVNGNPRILTGFAISDGGTGFVDQETVMVTAAPAIARFAGAMRGVEILQVTEVQDNNSGLTSVWRCYLHFEINSGGAPRAVYVHSLTSISGRRPALHLSKNGTTTAKADISLYNWYVPNPVYDGSAQVVVSGLDAGVFMQSSAQAPTPNAGTTARLMVDASDDCSNIKFIGFQREHVRGNGRNFRFGNQQVIQSDNFGNTGSTDMLIRPRNVIGNSQHPFTITLGKAGTTGGAQAPDAQVTDGNYSGFISNLGFSSPSYVGANVVTKYFHTTALFNTDRTNNPPAAGKVTLTINGETGLIYIDNRTTYPILKATID